MPPVNSRSDENPHARRHDELPKPSLRATITSIRGSACWLNESRVRPFHGLDFWQDASSRGDPPSCPTRSSIGSRTTVNHSDRGATPLSEQCVYKRCRCRSRKIDQHAQQDHNDDDRHHPPFLRLPEKPPCLGDETGGSLLASVLFETGGSRIVHDSSELSQIPLWMSGSIPREPVGSRLTPLEPECVTATCAVYQSDWCDDEKKKDSESDARDDPTDRKSGHAQNHEESSDGWWHYESDESGQCESSADPSD
jgi:hypothetical protein